MIFHSVSVFVTITHSGLAFPTLKLLPERKWLFLDFLTELGDKSRLKLVVDRNYRLLESQVKLYVRIYNKIRHQPDTCKTTSKKPLEDSGKRNVNVKEGN